jgi:hypothetical protein
MPFSFLTDEAAVLPLKGIAFQCLLLVVAIALESMVLRRQLRLGFQPAVYYATILNLLAVVLGWTVFLSVEPLLPISVRTQLISYVLFDTFYANSLTGSLGVSVVLIGLVIFFLTFWVKSVSLEWLTWLLGKPIVKSNAEKATNRFWQRRSQLDQDTQSPHVLAVLQANAASFSAVLALLLLRYWIA